MVATIPYEPEVIHFSCQHCHAQLTVPATMAGVSGPCPSCANTLTAPVVEATGFNQTHLEALSPTVVEPSPLAVDRPKAVNPQVNAAEPNDQTGSLRGIHVGLFEKRGFRIVRTALAVASSIAIFMSFYVMKSRRWVWEPGPDGMAGNPMPSKPTPATGRSMPGADSTNRSVAPPPTNLQARTDQK